MALHETGEKKERLILVGVSLDRPMAGLYTTAGQDDTADSLLELAELDRKSTRLNSSHMA